MTNKEVRQAILQKTAMIANFKNRNQGELENLITYCQIILDFQNSKFSDFVDQLEAIDYLTEKTLMS